jgi:RNA polymerase subunit RPABC4/transcription elongation factor Spt4
MVVKEKACLNCKVLFLEDKCPICNETIATENWKGKIHIFNAEKSEVAKNMGLKQNGEFAIKTK